MGIKQLVAQIPPTFAALAQPAPSGGKRHGVIVVEAALNNPPLDQLQNHLSDGLEILRLKNIMHHPADILPVGPGQMRDGGRGHGHGIHQQQGRFAQHLIASAPQHIAQFQVAMRTGTGSLEC